MGAITVPGTIHVTSSTAHSGVAMTSTMTHTCALPLLRDLQVFPVAHDHLELTKKVLVPVVHAYLENVRKSG